MWELNTLNWLKIRNNKPVDFKQYFWAAWQKWIPERPEVLMSRNPTWRRVWAGLAEYRVMFASLGVVCSVLVDLLAVAANWIEDPCKWNHLRLLQGWELNSSSGDNNRHDDRNGTLKDLWIRRDLGLALRPLLNWLLYKMVCQTAIVSYRAYFLV